MSGDWAGPGFSTPYADPDMDPAHARLGRLAAEVKADWQASRFATADHQPLPVTGRAPINGPEVRGWLAARQATEPEPEAG
jgi:hypothetical protein